MSYSGSSIRQVLLRPKINKSDKFLIPTGAVKQHQSLKPLLPKSSDNAPRNGTGVQLNGRYVENGTCYLCLTKKISYGYRLFQYSNAHSSQVLSKIAQLMGDGCLVIVNPDDIICEKCYYLLIYMTTLEEELGKVQSIIRDIVSRKCGMKGNDGQESKNLNEDVFKRLLPIMHTIAPISPNWVTNFNQSPTQEPPEPPKPPPVPTNVGKITHKCPMCDLQFDTQRLMQTHKIDVHLTSWTCHFCDAKIMDQTAYTLHVKKHLMKFKNKCTICEEVFSEEDELTAHMTSHQDEVPGFPCNLCNVAFYTEEGFEQHNQMHGDVIINNIDLFEKQELHELNTDEFVQNEESSPDLIDLIDAEEASLQDINELVCAECATSFKSMAEMTEHFKTAHNLEQCSMCSVVGTKEEISAHVQETHPTQLLDNNMSCDESQGETDLDVNTENCSKCGEVVDELHEQDCNGVELVKSEIISCGTCGVEAESEELLSLHMLLCKSSDIIEEGELADNQPEESQMDTAPESNDVGAYAAHIARTSRAFPCLGCGILFSKKAELFVHEKENPDHASVQCPDCNEQCPHERSLNEHREKNHLEWHCRHCQKMFTNLKQLKAHESRHVRTYSTRLECPEAQCGRVFQTQTGLRHHMIMHTGEFKFTCEFCNKGFVSKARYLEHKACHTKEKRYHCDICGAKFSVQATYWIHRKWHDDPLPYKCDICQQLFKHSSLLAVHKRKHTGEKPYSCQYCSQSFSVSSTLARHITLHTKVFPHVCKVCDIGFPAKHKMAQHMSKIHNDHKMMQEQIRNKSRKLIMAVKSNDEQTETSKPDTWIVSSVDGAPATQYLTLETNDGEKILLTEDIQKPIVEIVIDKSLEM